jgi:hypothetical protein
MTFFDHPYHPLTVHFPIAFYFLGVLLTLLYLWRNQPEYERFAYLTFLLSWLAAGVASLVGLVDQNQLEVADPRRTQLNQHITSLALLRSDDSGHHRRSGNSLAGWRAGLPLASGSHFELTVKLITF